MGEPTVHIYKDKRTGQPKGDATVSYEEAETAQAAVKWFDGVEFQAVLAWKSCERGVMKIRGGKSIDYAAQHNGQHMLPA